MKKALLNASIFGLQGKRMALVEIDALCKALNFVFNHASGDMKSVLKAKHNFSVVPILSEESKYAGRRMAVVDADKVEQALAYIRRHADETMLKTLSEHYQFELVPLTRAKFPKGRLLAMLTKHILGVAIFLYLLSLV